MVGKQCFLPILTYPVVMAPQIRSHKAQRASLSSTSENEILHAFDNLMKNLSHPSDPDSDSTRRSPLSPSYDLIMDGLRSQALDDAGSSFDKHELDAIYKNCQAMIDHLDGSDGKHHSPHGDSDDSKDDFVDERAQTIPCQSPPRVPSLHQESPVPSVHHIISKFLITSHCWLFIILFS